MLSGVDLRVRRMETRASTLPTFRESSDCGLSTCWPAKVELLIADAVAMILILTNCHTQFPLIPFLFSSSSLTYFHNHIPSRDQRRRRQRQLRHQAMQIDETTTTAAPHYLPRYSNTTYQSKLPTYPLLSRSRSYPYNIMNESIGDTFLIGGLDEAGLKLGDYWPLNSYPFKKNPG